MNKTAALIGAGLNAASRVSPKLAGRVGYELFCSPTPRRKVRDFEHNAHEQASVTTIVVNGKRTSTYRWGDGRKPVLMLHGWQSRGSCFADFIARLQARGLTPIGFDAPGHGDSGGRATTIVEYCKIARELQSTYGSFEAILGHSLGAMTAFLAVRGGIHVARLVAISGPSDFEFLVDAFCRKLKLAERLKQDLRNRLETRLFADEADMWARFSALHRPSEIAVPILVIHDERDSFVNSEHAHRLAAAYGVQAKLVITHNLGHQRILRDPGVIDQVVRFVDSSN